MFEDVVTRAIGNLGIILTFCFGVFFLFCMIFLPIFVWQIKNASLKTNRLIQEIIDKIGTVKP